MSNRTLIERIESGLADIRAGKISARTFAEIVRNNGRALEGMPYALIREFELLALELEIADWYVEDGFSPELAPLLVKTQAWLAMLPRDV
ncbi:hypothetical protein ACFFTM_14445 [Pseudoduganella plicata]|uniref:Uncharacterized protein n=1 Tax=Pseudoduganella plicata TaxID=321984 RepID=A0AA87YCP9_9BURK|nr:hypothetical protein GCM10007388_23540 [Pseudoduganella plicata]